MRHIEKGGWGWECGGGVYWAELQGLEWVTPYPSHPFTVGSSLQGSSLTTQLQPQVTVPRILDLDLFCAPQRCHLTTMSMAFHFYYIIYFSFLKAVYKVCNLYLRLLFFNHIAQTTCFHTPKLKTTNFQHVVTQYIWYVPLGKTAIFPHLSFLPHIQLSAQLANLP